MVPDAPVSPPIDDASESVPPSAVSVAELVPHLDVDADGPVPPTIL